MSTTSVCIPTFSRPHFLREAIISVLSQTERDLEVVVGDDGALGRAVVDDLGDTRVRYVRNPTRLGIAGNWASVLNVAHGNYLALLMDDDRWDPTFLTRTTTILDDHPEVDIVFCNHRFDNQGRLTTRPTLLPEGTHRQFTEQFLRLRPVAVSAALFRRSCWEHVRPLPDTAAADMILFGRMADAGHTFHYLDEVLMTYRSHDSGFSSKPAFRDDTVRAWEALELRDPAGRTVRDALLGRALTSRAAWAISEGRLDDARSDLRRARKTPGSSVKAWLLTAAASSTLAAAVAVHVARLYRRARSRSFS
jgi:glycosyltransferase involved in cell wall biosynthesis